MSVQKIILDTKKTTPIYEYPITLRQGDTSIQIPVEITDNFVTKDLSNTKLAFLSDKPDATTIEDDEQSHFKIGADKKSFTYTFPDELTDASGSTSNTYFKIGSDSTSNFYIHILSKAGMEKIESGDYISKVDRIFNHVMSDYSAINDLSETAATSLKASLDKMNSDYTNFINSKNTEFKTYLATLDKQATDVKSKLSTVKSQLDALEVPHFGVRNYIRNSDFSDGLNHWYFNTTDSKEVTYNLDHSLMNKGKTGIHMFGTPTQRYYGLNQYVELHLLKGQKLTFSTLLSFDGYAEAGKLTVGLHYKDKAGNILSQEWGTISPDDTSKESYSKRYSYTYTVADDCEKINVMIYNLKYDGTSFNSYLTEVSLTDGNISDSYLPAPEEKVNVSDTNDWQKSKITADNGSMLRALFASDNKDLKEYLGNLPIGFYTFYAQAGVKNNPAGSNPIRGWIHITNTIASGGGVIGDGYMVDTTNTNAWTIGVNLAPGGDYNAGVIFKKIITDSDTSNWQKQRIFRDGDYLLNACPKGTDFGEYLKSNNVPLGLSIIRDQNTQWNWRIEKESTNYIFGLGQDAGGTVYHLEILNGVYQGYKKIVSNLIGQTITATDDTGKTVKLKITGLS